MTVKERASCINTIKLLQRLAFNVHGVMDVIDAKNCDKIIKILKADAQQWIPCSERLPEEYGEYRITWVTSAAPGKRFIADSEFELTSVWDNEHYRFNGEWLLDEYIKNYPNVEVLAWKPLEEPWNGEQP